MGKTLRFGLAVTGLTALIGVNLTVAMSLDSGNPPPIRHGVSDLMSNPGWTLATYQLFPWWLSEEFESAVVVNGGLSGQPGIRFADTNVLFPQIRVNTERPPVRITGDRDEVLRELEPFTKTLPEQTLFCQPDPTYSRQLCTAVVAWDQSLVDERTAEFVVINLGAARMALVEARLLDTLAFSSNLVEPGRAEEVSQ